jgi:ribosomal protein L11 methyltransferase
MHHAAIRFDVSGEHRETLEGFFLTHTAFAGMLEHDDGSITFYIPSKEWDAALKKKLDSFCQQHADVKFLGTEIIKDRDWNAEWEATILPVQATPELVITPSWKMEDAKKIGANYIVTIDPKMSFGTGHHETTRLCLAAIESMELKGCAVLDIGTGSGVLAIYALLRGAREALGIDTDKWAIENARENRALNHRSDREFEIRTGTIDRVRKQEVFHLILANLHRNMLLEIPDQIHSHALRDALIVLSGILIYDTEEIRAAYEKANFEFIRELKENEWSCMIFRTCE